IIQLEFITLKYKRLAIFERVWERFIFTDWLYRQHHYSHQSTSETLAQTGGTDLRKKVMPTPKIITNKTSPKNHKKYNPKTSITLNFTLIFSSLFINFDRNQIKD
ncbi:MAG: hypothetical protein M9958_12680, partial [Chitinophagales bacterium]|nr:hypothetical protein [Chitinophagales bacterium]